MDWNKISETVSGIVSAALPVVQMVASAAFPGAGVAISLGEKLLQGVLMGIPSAIKLTNDIKEGKKPTQQELQDYEAEYESAYQQLKKHTKEQLEKLDNDDDPNT